MIVMLLCIRSTQKQQTERERVLYTVEVEKYKSKKVSLCETQS